MIKELKKVVIALLLLGVPSLAFAGIHYNLSDFETGKLKTGLSYVKIDDRSFAKVSLNPNLSLGPVGVGLDLNLFLPSDGGEVPTELQAVNLRMVSYDHDDMFGVKYGRLQNVNYGYGLLVDSYDSGSLGSSEFSMKKAGIKGYLKQDPIRVDVMNTATSVQAARLSLIQDSSFILGSPVVVGLTYIRDTNGISETVNGVDITRDKQNGLGVDLGLPIGGDFLTTYVEYARLDKQGTGAAAGVKGTFFDQLDYRFEYRQLGVGFVPGYFNQFYEATSFDFETDSPKEKINGFYGSSAVGVLNGAAKAGLIYEAYEGKEALLSAAAGWQKFNNTVGVINYTMPFRKDSNPIVKADILYYTGGLFDVIAHIKRVYITSSTYTESWSFGTRLNLDNLFPSIPFVN